MPIPDWDEFLAGDIVEFPDPAPNQVFLSDFREDPEAHPRQTPSGRIELFSERVASFGLSECPGHATWAEPRDWGQSDNYPLTLISGQPGTRLHSQFDNGAVSTGAKIAGREPALINEKDAARRGIATGDVVELFNGRGRCLAGAKVTPDIAEGVVFLWTGAWYDPEFNAQYNRDRHGNPNTLTHDQRTSEFSQSPAAHSARIGIRKLLGEPPQVHAHLPPEFVPRPQGKEASND